MVGVCHQLDHATRLAVDIAATGMSDVLGDGLHRGPGRACLLLGHAHRPDLGIGEGHPGNGCVVSDGWLSSQRVGHQSSVVIREVGESAQSVYVAHGIDAIAGAQGFWIDLDHAARCL